MRDSARTDAFHRAITSVVQPGDVVLDVGAGSGILSLFAARAGARRVYAVEQTSAAQLVRALARVNGLDGIVRVVHAPVERAVLPERVDIIVSEWLGTIGIDENLLAPVLIARDRWLKPGGRLLPQRVTAWMAPAWIPMRPERSFFRQKPYGIDLSPLAETSVHELLSFRRRIFPDNLIAAPCAMWETNVATVPRRGAALPARTHLEFRADARSAVNALVAWFSADLTENVGLTNAPGAPDTHWGQLVLPLDREHVIEESDTLEVSVVCIPAGPERTHFAWSVRVGAGDWEHHDTRSTGVHVAAAHAVAM